ncbi:PfkB family carbohydrate kinase [Kitasatospora sp. RB6PN24]|uniref:PfkB family carbohydrate kinase n=1 Tax=Kitasatospora humi TaxID=2893891 RepID=UPI001E444609|nr:PfkB family carbohydrate kinase [Kitasatospora humi]MCC9305908.1 PfkB family carbohydrate kinase [Kitasatospora humi]
MTGPLVVVGDALLDRDVDGDATRLAPDAPVPVVDVTAEHSRPGGAALAACLAARTGREVVLVTALGHQETAAEVRRRLADRVRLAEFPLDGPVPVKTRIRVAGRPLVRVDHEGGRPGRPGEAVRLALGGAAAILVADYGRGVADAVRPLLSAVARTTPLVWDPHPRGGAPVPGVRLATPNAAEARTMAAVLAPGAEQGDGLADHSRRAALLTSRWQATAVAVTLGAGGALLSRGADSPILLPAPYRTSADPCGAGDCFAATVVAALADGAIAEEAVQQGVAAATAFVAAGGASSARLWNPATAPVRRSTDPIALAEAVRAGGGTVVAAGGCFDLLHAGHVSLLESARGLGDCLIICLNSDRSVRRLKGPGRPFNPAEDRARVLAGLGCVDGVVVFDEDTPHEVLRRLRPHLWIKGGDYTAETLPEAAVLDDWGGHAMVLPYLDGRSTSTLARRAAATVAPGTRP